MCSIIAKEIDLNSEVSLHTKKNIDFFSSSTFISLPHLAIFFPPFHHLTKKKKKHKRFKDNLRVVEEETKEEKEAKLKLAILPFFLYFQFSQSHNVLIAENNKFHFVF